MPSAAYRAVQWLTYLPTLCVAIILPLMLALDFNRIRTLWGDDDEDRKMACLFFAVTAVGFVWLSAFGHTLLRQPWYTAYLVLPAYFFAAGAPAVFTVAWVIACSCKKRLEIRRDRAVPDEFGRLGVPERCVYYDCYSCCLVLRLRLLLLILDAAHRVPMPEILDLLRLGSGEPGSPGGAPLFQLGVVLRPRSEVLAGMAAEMESQMSQLETLRDPRIHHPDDSTMRIPDFGESRRNVDEECAALEKAAAYKFNEALKILGKADEAVTEEQVHAAAEERARVLRLNLARDITVARRNEVRRRRYEMGDRAFQYLLLFAVLWVSMLLAATAVYRNQPDVESAKAAFNAATEEYETWQEATESGEGGAVAEGVVAQSVQDAVVCGAGCRWLRYQVISNFAVSLFTMTLCIALNHDETRESMQRDPPLLALCLVWVIAPTWPLLLDPYDWYFGSGWFVLFVLFPLFSTLLASVPTGASLMYIGEIFIGPLIGADWTDGDAPDWYSTAVIGLMPSQALAALILVITTTESGDAPAAASAVPVSYFAYEYSCTLPCEALFWLPLGACLLCTLCVVGLWDTMRRGQDDGWPVALFVLFGFLTASMIGSWPVYVSVKELATGSSWVLYGLIPLTTATCVVMATFAKGGWLQKLCCCLPLNIYNLALLLVLLLCSAEVLALQALRTSVDVGAAEAVATSVRGTLKLDDEAAMWSPSSTGVEASALHDWMEWPARIESASTAGSRCRFKSDDEGGAPPRDAGTDGHCGSWLAADVQLPDGRALRSEAKEGQD